MPRAEINNSLTGKVGKQAAREGDSGEHSRNLAGEEVLYGWNQPWGQQMLGHLDQGLGYEGLRQARAEKGWALWPGRPRFKSSSVISQLNTVG